MIPYSQLTLAEIFMIAKINVTCLLIPYFFWNHSFTVSYAIFGLRYSSTTPLLL